MKVFLIFIFSISNYLISYEKGLDRLAEKLQLLELHDNCRTTIGDKDLNLSEVLLALEEKDFDHFQIAIHAGLEEKTEYDTLYQYLNSLLIAAKGDPCSARKIIDQLNSSCPKKFQSIPVVINDFIDKLEKTHSCYLLLSSLESSKCPIKRELSREEKNNIMHLIWGTGKVVSGIFIFATGHPGTGLGMITTGAIEVGKELLKMIDEQKKENHSLNP